MLGSLTHSCVVQGAGFRPDLSAMHGVLAEFNSIFAEKRSLDSFLAQN